MKMRKILEINSVPYGSTCKIMLGIAEVAREQGHEVRTASGYSYHPVKELPADHYPVGGVINKAFHMALARINGYHGCYSRMATRRLLREIKRGGYELLHFHNLHGWYVNLPMLFSFVKKQKLKVVWTLHDCWSFTGQCPHFTMIGCDKWKSGCYDCPQCGRYPESRTDRSAEMYELKKKWFTGVEDLTLVTPSRWLADLTRQSFLKEYPVKVIHNGIDLSVFRPVESDFRARHGLEDKRIVLGVSFGWDNSKGLDVFCSLAQRLGEPYKVVLVGTDEKTDRLLPPGILSIHRTRNQQELAEIYSAADVFVNPTREEVFGLTTAESIACGTPAIVFATGGCVEVVDETSGIVVPCDDVDRLQEAVIHVCEEKPFDPRACRRRAEDFDDKKKNQEYLTAY